MENTDEIVAFVQSLDTSIANLDAALVPALAGSIDKHLQSCSSPQERIKICQNHLYATISVLFAYLKVLGVKTETHPIMKELERIKKSMKAFKELEQQDAQSEEQKAAISAKSADFLQQTLGTKGGKAVPESLKKPAISSVNFEGTHTKFDDEPSHKPQKTTQKQNKSKSQKNSGNANKVKKPSRK